MSSMDVAVVAVPEHSIEALLNIAVEMPPTVTNDEHARSDSPSAVDNNALVVASGTDLQQHGHEQQRASEPTVMQARSAFKRVLSPFLMRDVAGIVCGAVSLTGAD